MSVDEATREQKRRRNKEYRERWHHTTKGVLRIERNRPRDAEAAVLAAQIPTDTRTLSQALLGDPLPGRSALDRRRFAEQDGNIILLRLERSDSCALPETDGLK